MPEMQNIKLLNTTLAEVIEGQRQALGLIDAARHVLPFTYAFCVVNRPGARPLYLCDTYPEGEAKAAVQTYVARTYLVNPIYNQILQGLPPGIHHMADHAPDNWTRLQSSAGILPTRHEEIGFRTPGWPLGLQELSLTVDLGQANTGEISFAHPAAKGGFSRTAANRLRPFFPLFSVAFRAIWRRHHSAAQQQKQVETALESFGNDLLTPREAEVARLVLMGHSSQSIALRLGIALPTVKTHRARVYSKLGVNTQQQLFARFMTWQAEGVD